MLTAGEEKVQLENSSPKAKKAMELFQEGYNCAQAVLGAFAQDMDMDFQQAMMLSSSFGGGMGRMREVCGAVSAMFMVAGLEKGYSDPKASTEKAGHYDYIQQLAAKFKEENGSIICRDLLGLTKPGPDTPVPEPRTEAYYKKRPCQLLVGQCAAILEQELNQ